LLKIISQEFLGGLNRRNKCTPKSSYGKNIKKSKTNPTMQQFVLVITSDRLFNEEHHPKFFEFLETMPQAVKISEDVFCFDSRDGISLIRSQIEKCLKENDEFALFQVSRAAWGTSREEFDARMKEIFRPPGSQ
jgi:hypothetical protein